MEIHNKLQEIGLNKREADVYLALAQLNYATANQIAALSKIRRTNVYDSINSLIEKGLVSCDKTNESSQYALTDPENLHNLIDEKISLMNMIIPTLLKKTNTTDNEFTEVLVGLHSFCNILENFLNFDDEILAYGIPKTAYDKLHDFLSQFHTKRIQKKIWKKHIYNHNAKEKINILNTMEYTEAKFLPEKYDSQAETCICGDEVIFCLWAEPIVSIRIKNKDMAESYKKHFYKLWDKASSN